MTVSNVITGLGAISALGANCSETLEGFRTSKRGAGSVTLFESDIDKPAFIVDEIPAKWDQAEIRTLSLANTAVEEALHKAGLTQRDGIRIGVCLGTTVACQLNNLEFYKELSATGTAPEEPIYHYLKGNLAEAVARQFKLSGPTLTIANACSSGTDALGIAKSWLNADLCDIVIAGGADELNKVPYAGFNSLGIYSNQLCKPFDKERDGLNLGEGAGIVILEQRAHAKKRGADFSLSCYGYGTFADAYHLTAPRPDGSGIEKAIRYALQEADLAESDIVFINAHGTATPNNDVVEGNALARIFGDNVRVYSTKGYTGHTLGAAGGLEAVFTALSLQEGWIPGNIGCTQPDPEIAVKPVLSKESIHGYYALSTSLAFGGNNSAVIIGRVF